MTYFPEISYISFNSREIKDETTWKVVQQILYVSVTNYEKDGSVIRVSCLMLALIRWWKVLFHVSFWVCEMKKDVIWSWKDVMGNEMNVRYMYFTGDSLTLDPLGNDNKLPIWLYLIIKLNLSRDIEVPWSLVVGSMNLSFSLASPFSAFSLSSSSGQESNLRSQTRWRSPYAIPPTTARRPIYLKASRVPTCPMRRPPVKEPLPRPEMVVIFISILEIVFLGWALSVIIVIYT